MRLLFMEFEVDDQPGRLGDGMAALGARCDVVRMHQAQSLPLLDSYDGIIALGGAMSANDDEHFPYIPPVLDALRDATSRHMPVLGVCLGGQLLARALGARVWRKTTMEIGYFPCQLTDAGKSDPLFSTIGETLITFQWHEDAFDLPPGATLLADSSRDTLQAFRRHNSYGVQFHPEVKPEVVMSWCRMAGHQLAHATDPTTPEDLQQRALDVESRFAEQTDILCRNFVALVKERAAVIQS